MLHYTKHPHDQWTMAVDRVRVPSARQIKYGDKRANSKGKPPPDVWALLPEHLPNGYQPDHDTWLASRVCGTFHEKEEDIPNQLPLEIVERIVLLTSNEGELVVDPFAGTGTTAEAARKHGRRFWGIDKSVRCANSTRERGKRGESAT